MNGNMSLDNALDLAPSDMIADALLAGIVREMETSNEAGDARVEQLRDAAARAATLAGHWHEPRESFVRLLGAAMRGGVSAVQARGILIGAYGADYGQTDPGPAPPIVIKSAQIRAPQ